MRGWCSLAIAHEAPLCAHAGAGGAYPGKVIESDQAAKLFGGTQPRVSDLLRGKINLFGLDTLVNMAVAAGLHVEMRVLDAA